VNAAASKHGIPALLLVVEDNPADADLIRDELIGDETQPEFSIQSCMRLKDGLERLVTDPPELVLLDLSLPDCRGLETFLRVYRRHPEIPIVIISGLDDLSLAFDAVRSGAQDYLFKGELERSMLLRSVHFALQRHERMRRLNPYLAGPSLQVPQADGKPRRDYHAHRIQGDDPELFTMLVERYRELVELSCKQRLYRMVQNVSGELHGLAMYLCMLQAGAEDAETIHVAALEQLVGQVAPDQASTYVEEAQLLLIELYRYLTEFYRDSALGRLEDTSSDASADPADVPPGGGAGGTPSIN